MQEVDRAHARLLELTRARRYNDAVAFCKENIERWDAAVVHEAWDHLSYALWCSGQRDEAMATLSKAIELAPNDRSHLFSRALWATTLDRCEVAEADWSELIRLEEASGSEAFTGVSLAGRALVRARMENSAKRRLMWID